MRRLKIILDLQACQCVSRYRGIGRYSLAFARALAAAAPHHDVHVMLNGMFPESLDDLRHAFSSLLDRDRILTWTGEGPTAECDPANRPRRERAERSREEFLAAQSPDIVHISSLFEGYPDNAVTSVGECSNGPSTAVTVYDLIPLVHRKHYLGDDPNTPISQYYFRKLNYVRRASLSLAISEATRQEAIDHLSLDPKTVVNISTAADAMFRPYTPESGLLRRVGAARPFVMYTGGPDRRKNIDGLIKGWALLPPAIRQSHQLMVVCRLSDGHQASLRALAAQCGMSGDELILPGFVSDDDLLGLYNLATLFVFPSWHEGFGLPVLEAMACGTAVLAANTSSLPEVVGWPDALFDPMDPAAIAAAMQRVLTDDSLLASLRAHSLQRARLFSWQTTARRALDAFEALSARGNSVEEPAA